MDSHDEDISYTSLLSGNYHLSLVDSPPVPPSNRTNIKKSMRGSNFSIEEDKLLVSVWLNCSPDAIQGTNQTRSTFWEQVVEYFHQHKESTNERTMKSLSHRWSYIQKATNSFCVGEGEDHDVPKEKTVIVSTPTTSSPTQNVTENEVIELDRPTGRKAEKHKRKVEAKKMKYAHLEESRAQEKEFYRLKAEKFAYDRKAKEEKLRLQAEKMELSLQAEKLRLEAEKTELAKKESNERIMMMDVNSMPEIQRSYFEERQREIMRRSRA
ncbi:hypothetical protein M8C21_032957 [Ambrosia artemisiifolia]|uniref:No apical meristem-associated C-terminal domain-containing protein n=1 Tax=Ambrosia artemisiifolia TaxID=4212 RepID=A0AAD5GQY5_AMBAR|nr:hypothetical protein M8C21_032957 [Ambrosia artemisiifolia]